MKLFFLLLALTVLFSCKKKYCYVCETTTRVFQGSTNSTNISRTQVCDKTDDEIKAYEKQNSRTENSFSGNTTTTVSSVMQCNR